MLDHIKAHSIMVEKVAATIAQGLRDAGIDISLEIITAGALMHDISKTYCLKFGGNHAALGKKLCLENNMEEIAEIVSEHVRLKDARSDQPVNEKEVIYYADKRVNHDKVVSLQERLKYLLNRYGKRENIHQAIRKNFDFCKLIEKKLFINLKFRPEDLPRRINFR